MRTRTPEKVAAKSLPVNGLRGGPSRHEAGPFQRKVRRCEWRESDEAWLYVGQGLGSAVAALVAGTCWAKSLGGKATAQATAKGNAHRFRQALGIEKQ